MEGKKIHLILFTHFEGGKKTEASNIAEGSNYDVVQQALPGA